MLFIDDTCVFPQVQKVLKNGLGFFKLMQPDADAATLWQAGMTLALAHDLDEAGASRWLADAGLREP